MTPGWLTRPAWEPVEAPLTGGTAQRSAALYLAIVAQFLVETAERYARTAASTFCNVFTWDVTRAMACEVPHWWFRSELDANQQVRWLFQHGPTYGWREVDGPTAQSEANLGRPTIATFHNPGGIGHVAMVVPAPSDVAGNLSPGVWVAQAGASNHSRWPIEKCFGTHPVKFITHL